MSTVTSGISSLSGSLAMSGVFSSINTDTLVQREMAIAQIPMTELTTQKQTITAKETALADLTSSFKAVRSAADKLRSASTLRATTTSVSDTTVLTATSNGGALSGSHTIVVGALATAKRQVHAGLAASDTKVGAGAFSYTYKAGQSGAVTRTIYTTADTTLTDLQNLINNDAGNPGVTASILNYSDGSGGQYHLVLSGHDSGSTFNAVVNDAATTLNGSNGTVDFRQATFMETQQAQDAKVRVDGYPVDPAWITRSSNTISDVVPGLTLTLQKLGTTNVTVSQDTATFKSNLQNLVTAYNSLVTKMNQYTGYDGTTKTGGILQGDSVTNNMLFQLRSPLTAITGGFVPGTDSFVGPADIGLSVDKNGQLAIDEDTLDEALAKNYDGVLNLVGAQGRGSSSDSHIQFNSAALTTTSGAYEVQADFGTDGTLTAARVRKAGQIEWHSANVSGSTITGADGKPEQGLSLTAVWDGSSTTQSATVNVQEGFAGAVYDQAQIILDPVTGTMTSKKAQYDSALTAVGKQIDDEQRRLDQLQTDLKAKYARMETMLAQLDAFRAAYASLTGTTSSSSSSSGSSSSSSSSSS